VNLGLAVLFRPGQACGVVGHVVPGAARDLVWPRAVVRRGPGAGGRFRVFFVCAGEDRPARGSIGRGGRLPVKEDQSGWAGRLGVHVVRGSSVSRHWIGPLG